MKISRLLGVAGLSIALFGAGCQRTQPVTVGTPPSSDVAVANQQDEVAPMGNIDLQGGSAKLTRGPDTVAVQDGVEVLPGDAVTVTSGTIALVYPEAGASYLEKGTTVTVLPDGQGQGSVFTQLEVSAGSVWTRFERLLGPDEKFSVSGNGVVATVRGTAFGFQIVNGSADVQVADHAVDVSTLEQRGNESTAVRLEAGKDLKVDAKTLKLETIDTVKTFVRDLNESEKNHAMFQAIAQHLKPELLRRRLERIRLERPAVIPTQFENRIDPTFLARLKRLYQMRRFVAPSRPVLLQEIAPSTTPSVK